MTVIPPQNVPNFKMFLDQFKNTRSQTLELVKPLEKEDYVVQTAFFMSPPKWHLGHVSWFYEIIMSKINPGYEFHSKEYSKIFNSYYQSLGQPHDKAKRGILSRPTVQETLDYFFMINKKVEDFLSLHRLAGRARAQDDALAAALRLADGAESADAQL